MLLCSKKSFFSSSLKISPCSVWVSAIPIQSYKVIKQSINKCWSRQERTEEVFVWSACTMTFSPTSKEFKLLLYCILPLTTTLCHWVRKGSVDVPREEKKKATSCAKACGLAYVRWSQKIHCSSSVCTVCLQPLWERQGHSSSQSTMITTSRFTALFHHKTKKTSN